MPRKYTINSLFSSLLLLVSAAALAAPGDDITHAMVDLDASYDSGRDVWFEYDGVYYGAYASEFDKTKLDLLPAGGSYDGIYEWDTAAYCVDILQPAEFSSNYEAALINFDDPRLLESNEIGFKRAAWIMDNYSGSGNAVQNAAVQMAIWESISDATLDLDSGKFKLDWGNDTNVVNKADDYLEAVLTADLDDLKHIYKVAYHAEYQDVLVTIPLPASVWLFGSAFAGLIGLGKRRKNQS